MPFDLFHVIVDDPSAEIANLNKLGVEESMLLSFMDQEVRKTLDICKDAARATVPRDTEELLNNIVVEKQGRTGGRFTSPHQGRVYVNNAIHESSKTNLKLNNVVLSDVLDDGYAKVVAPAAGVTRGRKGRKERSPDFQRSQSSASAGPFPMGTRDHSSPTANWITQAQDLACEYLEHTE